MKRLVPILLILTGHLSSVVAEPSPGRVTVLSPSYCSDISGSTPISIAAPGFSAVTVKC